MTFLRPGHPRTLASPVRISTKKPRRISRLVSLFSLSAASLSGAAHAKPFKAVGVKAWTSGSQTFIRARPGANVPVVAKVARHTPLYVWGKYDGWYRVETHDHVFGWVFNQYINSPALSKVREMPRSKARVASNRTANQTMYGSPQLLKKHLAVYGAPGAVKGLEKQGIRVAMVPKTVAPKRKTVVAITPKPKIALAPKPKIVVAAAPKRVVKPIAKVFKPRLASVPRVRERVSPIPIVEAPPRVTPVKRVASPKTVRPKVLRVALPVKTAPIAPRAVESKRIAALSRSMTPAARRFALAASEAANKPTQSGAPSTVAVAPRQVEISPAIAAKPKRVAAPRAKAKPKKVVAKKSNRNRYVSKRNKNRNQLRAKMGLTPAAIPSTMIAPVSPAELLKARQEYLDARKNQLNSPTPTAPLSPSNGESLGGPSNSLAPAMPATISPSSFEGQADFGAMPLVMDGDTHPLQPLLSHPYVVALSQLKPPTTVAPIAARGGSPRDRAPLHRGGSPRDRIGAGMATQALSYRGMPYIRGAASPQRGFDCSGLIYFLLRQRGYSPPRTAAGYRNWGVGVTRADLKAGDLVLFANTYKRGISHIGVYLGENKFVHAATSSTGVRVSSLNERYYAGKYFGARRPK